MTILLRNKLAIILATLVILTFLALYIKNSAFNQHNPTPSTKATATTQPDSPVVVSTNPSPLEDTIIPATQVLEITFNKPLQNSGEFKARIEPTTDFKIELSSDRKTAKIIPIQPYELGSTYTLFIGPETKFDGVGRWGQEKVFHFRTIRYRGV